MAKYGVPVPAVAVKARTRRNLTAVGLMIVIGMAVLAVRHDSAAARGAPQSVRHEVLPPPRDPLVGAPALASLRAFYAHGYALISTEAKHGSGARRGPRSLTLHSRWT